MKKTVLIFAAVALVISSCNSDSKRLALTTKAMAGMICEGTILEEPLVQKEYVDKLLRDKNRVTLIADARAELVPDINRALAGAGITEDDLSILSKALNKEPDRGNLVDAIGAGMNEQCPDVYLSKNQKAQYAIAAIVILYADPALIRR
ncbi:MAG: hypothetical protein JXR91_04840 [Deltaproteobacteria bacterium]|nr:hypothetical protein [Deltaproteobacteria bacterium]